MIVYVTEERQGEYESFIAAHPKGHFVKSIKWAEFKNPWKWEAFLSVDESGKIRGSMMIFISRVKKSKYTHMYLPRGPVVDDKDLKTLAELTDEAKRLGERYNAYELSTDPDIIEGEPYLNELKSVGFVENNTRHRPEYLQARYVFRLDLRGKSADELFAEFHSKTRYNVRLSVKKGVTCRVGDKSDLPAFCEIMRETAARDGFIGRGLSYFERMYDVLAPENLRVYMMEYEGVAIAGAIAIYYGDKVWYLYGASSNRERNRMPNYLMQWEMIQWAVEKGCAIYDFRGITGDMEKTTLDGLIRFKSGFNGKQVDFVGKLDLLFKPRAAKRIEYLQSTYRALVRRLKIKK